MSDDLISRQAAIDAIEIEKSLCERPITETRWFDFGLGKAQEVLSKLHPAQPEQKTPPKHGTGGMTMADYLSREAVFDWFCESADIDGCVDLPKNNGSCKKGCRHCIDGKELDEIQTADVRENVHGRWIVDEDGNIECSVCGHHGVGDLYCERCGAQMEVNDG